MGIFAFTWSQAIADGSPDSFVNSSSGVVSTPDSVSVDGGIGSFVRFGEDTTSPKMLGADKTSIFSIIMGTDNNSVVGISDSVIGLQNTILGIPTLEGGGNNPNSNRNSENWIIMGTQNTSKY
jgi:hypothetical protein